MAGSLQGSPQLVSGNVKEVHMRSGADERLPWRRCESNKEVKSFAAVAAKVTDTTYAHKRFICANEDTRRKITKPIWDKFQAALESAILEEMMKSGGLKFKSQWPYFAPSGCGRVGCLDAESAAWLDQFTSKYTDDMGDSLKAWKRGDFGSLHRMFIHVPSCIKNIRDKVMDMILVQNCLPGTFRIFNVKDVKWTSKSGKEASGTHLQVEIDEELKNAIMAKGKTLFLGSRSVNMSSSDNQKRKGMTQESRTTATAPVAKQSNYDLTIIPSEEDFWKLPKTGRQKYRTAMEAQGLRPYKAKSRPHRQITPTIAPSRL
ncbi:hypothetical protein TCAL_14471 [Tigriopus californicus]|uniref:DUF4780 domain-containing protein n=1 Tax=Tigriopus californicus TaxID=6832 RepID=A0A553PTS2_TIGCA|nr:hypothetical protein TCAL_14471 [Tigriopus californicus]